MYPLERYREGERERGREGERGRGGEGERERGGGGERASERSSERAREKLATADADAKGYNLKRADTASLAYADARDAKPVRGRPHGTTVMELLRIISLARSLNDFADLEVVLPLQWNQ